MPKYSLYLPDDLLASMKEFKGTPHDPNWSALAQEAFRLEVQRLKNRKEGASKMQAAIERLRASKERHANQDYTNGHAAGIKWATDRAEYPQLERAAKMFDHGPGLETLNMGYAGRIYTLIAGIDYADVLARTASEPDARQFWQSVGVESPSFEFLRGFLEGAKEIFEAVDGSLQ